MKLSVSHVTSYTYPVAQKRLIQSQRLVPAGFDGQHILEWNVETEGAIWGAEFRDGAGDLTRTATVPGPVEGVTVTVEGLVETTDLAGVLRGFREKVPPLAYTSSTRLTRPDVALEDLASETLANLTGASQLDRAHAMSAAVTEAIAYQTGSTESFTTAAEALAQGRGVCQDQTHALIAMAISQRMPARYVAGYLFFGDEPLPSIAAQAQSQGTSDPDEQAEKPVSAIAEAGHAWAELYIDTLGWVGFDPANACCPDARYIRLCSGVDALDAAPIRGLTSGTGPEDLHVSVAVQSVQQ